MLPHDERFVRALNAHYGHSEYGDRIRHALVAAGADIDHLTAADLAPFDHLHGGQRPATLHLAALAGITGALQVADLGGGIGGPARTLAAEFGCSVDVVDLTAEFCRVGTWLTGLTGLEGRVRFHHASALRTPLRAGAYDVVWMQNSAMNIEDRRALYAEVARLLRPGGRYALQEVMAGPVSPVYYPTNWASTAETSFLRSPDEVRSLSAAAGLPELTWIDTTEEATVDARERANPTTGSPARPTYTPDALADQIAQNGVRNREEGRVLNVLRVFEKV